MSQLDILEKVTALLCLGHITINILTAIESMKTAAVLRRKWEKTVEFTTIAAFTLSVCVVVRWVTK